MSLVSSSLGTHAVNVFDLGDEVPEFNLDSQMGAINFRLAIQGRWCVFMTINEVDDPVTTTDLGYLSKLNEELEARNLAVIVIGNDTVQNYRRWLKDVEELQTAKIGFPVLSDPECAILRQFGCAKLDPVSEKWKVSCNGVFLIDIHKRIRLSMKYSSHVGRNLYEILRYYDALDITIQHKVVVPSNWGQGQDVFINNEVPEEQVKQYRYFEMKPWFKMTPCPENQ